MEIFFALNSRGVQAGQDREPFSLLTILKGCRQSRRGTILYAYHSQGVQTIKTRNHSLCLPFSRGVDNQDKMVNHSLCLSFSRGCRQSRRGTILSAYHSQGGVDNQDGEPFSPLTILKGCRQSRRGTILSAYHSQGV
jgi:hypothetical protein